MTQRILHSAVLSFQVRVGEELIVRRMGGRKDRGDTCRLTPIHSITLTIFNSHQNRYRKSRQMNEPMFYNLMSSQIPGSRKPLDVRTWTLDPEIEDEPYVS